MVWLKLLGVVFLILGFLILKFFPDIKQYQWSQMTTTGIFIGVIIFVFGILLLIFG